MELLDFDAKPFVYYVKKTCFSKIEKSSRCELHRIIKELHETELYFKQQDNCHFRQGLSKIRLCSHKFLAERGRWSKPRVEIY